MTSEADQASEATDDMLQTSYGRSANRCDGKPYLRA